MLELFVAPVHLDLLGALVTTSPIRLSVSASPAHGLVLGNVLTALSNLFNDRPRAAQHRRSQRPAGGPAGRPARAAPEHQLRSRSPPPTLAEGDVLALTVPAIDLDLLGLMLKTYADHRQRASREGDGLLLGNVSDIAFRHARRHAGAADAS